MKFSESINYKINPRDIIYKCIDPLGFDRDNAWFPIGCGPSYKEYSKKNDITKFTNNEKINTKLVFYSKIRITDMGRRGLKKINRNTIVENLNKKYKQENYFNKDYFENIGKYKFVFSPEGNAIDCHRHYETWISKGIPIIEYNSFIKEKYKTLPILWTRDYSEINDNYLESKYKEFLNKDFDFKRLLLSKYKPELRKKMITIMNAPYPSAFYVGRPRCGIKLWNYKDCFN